MAEDETKPRKMPREADDDATSGATAPADTQSAETATAVATAEKTEETEEGEEQEAKAADAKEKNKDEVVFVEDPAFEIDYKGDCAYEVKVSVPPANEVQEAQKLFDELKDGAEVPGFRRGRAPRKLIERKFSKAVKGEVAAKLASAAFRRLVEDKKLKPIAQPDLEGLEQHVERPEGQPLTFTLKFEVAPRVELGKYRGIEIERPVVTINEKDAADAIERMRMRFAVYETLTEGVAADGDQVLIDFRGTVDGHEFPGGAASNYPYILGTKRFFPEFEEVLRGSAQGAELTCAVTFDVATANESLRGKTAQFTIKVKEIKRRNPPALNDEFAKQVGADTVEALHARVSEQLRTDVVARSNLIAQERAIEAVVNDSTFELPQSVVKAVTEEVYQEERKRLLSERLPMSEIRAREDEMRKRAAESAINEIKRLSVFAEIAEAEGVEVSEADFDQEAEVIAKQSGVRTELVTKHIRDEERRSKYEDRISRAKVLKIIMDNAKATDKELTDEETEQEAHREGRDTD